MEDFLDLGLPPGAPKNLENLEPPLLSSARLLIFPAFPISSSGVPPGSPAPPSGRNRLEEKMFNNHFFILKQGQEC